MRARMRASGPRGFSLTELLVVIAIIVLLVGILLVALNKVQSKAKRTRTESTMTQFLNACTAFQQENGRFPGVIPETVLTNAATFVGGQPQITSTENALLDLMGGYRVLTPTDSRDPANPVFADYQAFLAAAQANTPPADIELEWDVGGGEGWDLVIDIRKLGEGPVINGKPHAAYFTPGPSDLARAAYPLTVVNPNDADDPRALLPELIDAWGQPILYLRQVRPRGPLFDVPAANPQFLLAGLGPYVQSTGLGELGNDQTELSILNTAPGPYAIMSKALVHGAIANQARGAICLISAGEDGVFFSETDGPGSESDPIDDDPDIEFDTITDPDASPKLMDEFDDIRVFGGG